ncbi:MAG: hypothetical protein P4M11_10765 [Candidatus Pacebacteria bacterium]|nr:hypothetical protein [Candidatus Paceibacterota bacterium]
MSYKAELDKQCRAPGKRLEPRVAPTGGLLLLGESREKAMLERRMAAKRELVREMQEHQESLVTEKCKQRVERAEYERFMKTMEEAELLKKSEKKTQRRKVAQELSAAYQGQELRKKQELLVRRETDRAEDEKGAWDMIDRERMRVLDDNELLILCRQSNGSNGPSGLRKRRRAYTRTFSVGSKTGSWR